MSSIMLRLVFVGLFWFSFGLGTVIGAPFTNGDFETPVQPSGSALGLGNSSLCSPWVSTTVGGNQGYMQNYLIANTQADGRVASTGTQAIQMNGDGVATTTMAQAFDTTPGQAYNVTFDLGIEPGNAGNPSTATLVASGAGNTMGTYQAIWVATAARYAPQGYKFTATGTSTTLTFSQSGGPVQSPLLDNVAVNPIAPLTPGLLVNGSFESPVIPSNGRAANTYHDLFLGNNGYIPGWVSITGINLGGGQYYEIPQLLDTGFVESGRNVKAAAGNQVAMLNSDGGTTLSLAQTFMTDFGTLYQLNFDLGREPGGAGNPSVNVQVTPGGLLVNYVATQDFTVGYLLQSYTFTGTGGLMTLTFSNSDGPNGASPAIDNVTLAVLSTIPEPASMTLLLLGLGGLLARRRRASR